MAPRWACRLLRRVAPSGRAEDVVGDLEEAHGRRVRERGRLLANVLTGIEALDVAFVLLRERRRLRRWSGGGSRVLHPERWMVSVADFRAAVRALRATPLVSAVAILSLGLAMGANTAMFSIVDSLVLERLPVRDAQRLAVLADNDDWYSIWWTNPIWESIRDRDLFEGSFAYGRTRFDLSMGGEVDAVDGLRASGGLFEVLGVNAALGRTFTEADDRRVGGPDGAVAVISHGFWQRRFGGARDVVGRTITLDRVPFTIIGVTAAEFFGPEVGRTFDVAVPLGTLALMGRTGLLDSRSSWWLQVMFRLPEGQTLEQASAVLRAVQAQIAEETRPTDLRAQDAAAHLTDPLRLRAAGHGVSELRQGYRRPLLIVMAIVALTLLVACGNIANLLLARATARRHEFAVRNALGASRWRLVRQLFTESLVLAVIGAVFGLGIAYWGSRLVVSQLSTDVNQVFLDLGMDGRVLGFTSGVAVATALLFGILPALRSVRVAPIDAMNEHGRGTSSERRIGLAGSLVVVQVALSLVLLVGAGLLVGTFTSLSNRELGFERDRALLVRIEAQRAGLDADGRTRLYEQIQQTVRAMPSVADVAVSVTSPLGDNTMNRLMAFPDRPDLPESERMVYVNMVSPGWFSAMGTPLMMGRDFGERDRAGAQRAVIVNEAFVTKYYAGESPIGRVIAESAAPTADATPLEIVGVVGDAIYRSIRQPAPPTMYWSFDQLSWAPTNVTLTVRSPAGSPAHLAPAIAEAVTALNQDLALTFRPFAAQVDATLTQERLVAKLSGFFGALALLLAALGLYGITSYAVNRRRIELGIRMALGESPGHLMRLVLTRVALLVGTGILIGTIASWWATTLLDSLLYDLAPRDLTITLSAIATLTAVAAFAGWIPARRAARIDPVASLRR